MTSVDRLFIGVHRDMPERIQLGAIPWGPLIHTATVARWGSAGKPPPGGWAFKEGPSTHAFMVVSVGAGVFRIDAGIPVTAVSDWGLPVLPTVLWEVLPTKDISVDNGVKFALQCVGRKYDVSGALAHALAPVVPAFLAPGVPWQGLQGGAGGDICSEEACQTLIACGGWAKSLGASVLADDHFPEELARALSFAENTPWLRRVHPAEHLHA